MAIAGLYEARSKFFEGITQGVCMVFVTGLRGFKEGVLTMAYMTGAMELKGCLSGFSLICGTPPAPTNYHLRYPKYHLVETVIRLTERHWVVLAAEYSWSHIPDIAIVSYAASIYIR